MKEREVEVVLFGAENSGDLKREYPGLADIEEFKDLSTHELRFCWLVGNRTSPIFQMDRFERMDRAMRIVWGQHYKTNGKIKELVDSMGQEDAIPEHILRGIYKMNTFNPAYRLKAKLMAEYIFETLNELIVLPQADLRTMDIDDRKKYSEFVINVSSKLQGMIDNIEGAYGIKTIDRKRKGEVLVNIHDVMR